MLYINGRHTGGWLMTFDKVERVDDRGAIDLKHVFGKWRRFALE